MGFLRGIFGGGTQPAIAPDYTGLQIQTAVNALPIPIVWGESRLAPNVIWYENFTATPVTSGSGGKGGIFNTGGGVTRYDYTASVILALCEGPITGIDEIWRNQSTYTIADLGLSLFTGTTPQTTWSYLTTAFPSQALPYQATAYVCAANYDLSGAATLDNHNFEVEGIFFGSGINGVDADPAHVVNDFLTNAQYGIAAPTGFPSASINSATLFGSGGDASLQTYCAGIGVAISPALTNQEKASSILTRWLKICNTAAVWSDGQLNFIPYGDTATTAGATQSTSAEYNVPASGTFITPYPTIYVCPTASFVADDGVVYAQSGSALTYIGTSAPTVAGTYGISPAGTYLFAPGDENVGVVISYQYSVGASFVPNVTPVYNLNDDDYLIEQNADPVQVSRTDPFEAYNVWRLEIAERANAYNLTTVESRDQNAVQNYGMRIAPTFTAHEICDPNVALIVGQLMLQRSVYIRNTYTFKLSWEYCLLDPMDLVTLTDASLGLSNAPVRIIQIEEDKDGFLAITAEEFPLGVATATRYATQTPSNNPINRNAAAPAINAPVVFEPPAALLGPTPVGNTPEVWIAASSNSANWGGCNVLLSVDGTDYQQIGQITAPARMGLLTAILPTYLGTNPDTVDTLTVNLAESGGVLSSISSLGSQLAANLCLVDDELLTYTTATLVSGNTYNLTGLNRGLYGTVIQSHAINAPFTRLDGAIFQYELPSQFLNQTLYLKFQSFNQFGNGVQPLADCTEYTYTPTAFAYAHPLASALEVGSVDLGSVAGAVSSVDDFSGGLVLQSTTASASFVVIAIDLSVYFVEATDSLIFRSTLTAANNQYMTVGQNPSANTQIFTFSTWFKYGGTSETANLFLASQGGGLGQVAINFVGGTSFAISGSDLSAGSYMSLTSGNLVSDENWHHLCVAIDTTQATAANRVKLWLDGTSETLSGTSPPQYTQMALAAGVGQQMSASTGGTISLSGGNRIHKFTSSGTFTSSGSNTVSYLAVAGGGGGAGNGGGGGGAGELLSGTASVTATGYTVTVGGGGTAGAGGSGSSGSHNGGNGGNSVFGSFVTATGGGGGGGYDAVAGAAGGSGGGGAWGVSGSAGGAGGSGTAGGNHGGAGGAGLATTNYQQCSGGGGGAGTAGAAGSGNSSAPDIGGAGGSGAASSISGSSVTYAGGGGGWGLATPGAGGSGGGGASGAAGATNSGGGGGGAGPTLAGYPGGTGVVIIAYPYYGNGTNSFGYGFDGKLAQTYYIDGQALSYSDFASGSPLAPIAFLGSYTGAADSFFAFNNGASVVTLGYDLSGENNNATLLNMTTANSSPDYP